MIRLLYTTPEVAAMFGVTDSAVRRQIERGDIEAVKFGRLWKVSRAELIRLGGVDPETGEAVE